MNTSPFASRFLVVLLAFVAPALSGADSVYVFSSLAGTAGTAGTADGSGAQARFDAPRGAAIDAAGNVYVADHNNSTIRKITPDGTVTTFAGRAGTTGSNDGAAADARFNHPWGLASDAAGNLYVADMWNCAIRKITPDGRVSTLAGQPGASGSADGAGAVARFNYPRALTVDSAGTVFVADTDNFTVRKVTATGVVSTLAGTALAKGAVNGAGSLARFNYPTGITLDPAGNLFVADEQNHAIRKVTPAGEVSTYAGSAGTGGNTDGSLAVARISYPADVALGAGGELFVTEGSHTLRRIAGDTVTTLAGSPWQSGATNGSGTAVRFNAPRGLAVDAAGNVFVADGDNHAIRKGVPVARPVIATQPAPITLLSAGEPLTLTVGLETAAGATYQWQRNGQPIAGATGASYTLAAVTRTNGGSYTVAASRAGVTVTSRIALVAVGTGGQPAIKSSVAPLLTVEYPVFVWPLNAKYPVTAATDNEAIHGRVGNACGPTGVANILRYWRHPQRGTGSRAFTDRLDCVWSFDFANTPLNFDAMPATVTVNSPAEQIDAVATLMYAAAVAAHNPGRTGHGGDVLTGFTNYLRYASGAQLALRADYTDAQWEALYKSELSGGRPLLMSGNEPGVGGHWFICDGYNAEGRFHIRWDYGEAQNQWLPLNEFKPYIADQSALIWLEPATEAAPVFSLEPQSRTVAAGASLTLTAVAATPDGGAAPAFQWQRNGADLPGATSTTLALAAIEPAQTGLYTAVASNPAAKVSTAAAIVGVSSSTKVIGAGVELLPVDIRHANGNVFDQVLLTGTAETIIADFSPDPTLNQITRTSYVDLNNDIVQVEFSGPGTLSIVLDDYSPAAPPVNYNQAINYVKGHAGIVITGANENTNVSVFSVGRATAVNQALFKDSVTYDGVADIAFIAISTTNGRFGGVRTADAHYFAAKGFTGLYAPGVQFNGPIYVGDLSAFDTATPVLQIGSSTSVTRITGGDLFQDNGRAVQVSGLTHLEFAAGSDSHARPLPAQANRAVLIQNGQDVTTQLTR